MTTSNDDTSYAVSPVEARFYYAGLPSKPTLVYRTGKPWFPPRNPEDQPQKKELRPVFNHPIVDIWSGLLGPEVVKVLDSHQVFFTTIDVVRFKSDGPAPDDEEDDVDEDADDSPKEAKLAIGPVTIWIGVFPESTLPSVAHKAAQDILALLARHQITDIDIDFRESLYTRQAGPCLHRPVLSNSPLLKYISPLTPALGLPISTKARPTVQGTMGLYLEKGDDEHTLLGLSCQHVIMDPKNGNSDYASRPRAPRKDVILLGKDAYTGLVESIQRKLDDYIMDIQGWKRQIERFLKREKGDDKADIAKATKQRVEAQTAVKQTEEAMEALVPLLKELKTHWRKLDDRVLGPIVCSPRIAFGVGAEQFTEDWGIFKVDRTKLGDDFQGNKIDLGTKLSRGEFTRKCFPRGDANWTFDYPDDRLLPLHDTLTDDLMRHPDMWDASGEPCLLVVKNGGATGTTIGRANGVSSIIRHYYSGDMAIRGTSMEWGICSYDKSEIFSEAGDSGSIIADIRGRIGGLLTGGCGITESSDITYATPFWWLLPRIRAHGLPNINININVNVN